MIILDNKTKWSLPKVYVIVSILFMFIRVYDVTYAEHSLIITVKKRGECQVVFNIV